MSRAARLCLVNRSAQRSHLSAIRRHVSLSSRLRENLAINSHSAACLRNSSGGLIGASLSDLGFCSWRYAPDPTPPQYRHNLSEQATPGMAVPKKRNTYKDRFQALSSASLRTK